MTTILVLLVAATFIAGWKKFSARKEKLTRYLEAHKPITSQKRRIEEGF